MPYTLQNNEISWIDMALSKSTILKSFSYILDLFLCGLFVYQCVLSFAQYRAKRVGTLFTTIQEKEFVPPVMYICPYYEKKLWNELILKYNKNLTKIYSAVEKHRVENPLVKKIMLVSPKAPSLANNGFDAFDHETSILTQTDSQTETHKICEIFTQKTLARVGGKGGVQMVIEFDQVEFVIVGLSNPLMTYPTFTPVFGSQFRFLSRSDLTMPNETTITQVPLKAGKTIIKNIPTENDNCLVFKARMENLGQCVDNFVEKSIQCKLPWNKNTKSQFETCQTVSQYDKFDELTSNLTNEGGLHLKLHTDCNSLCKYEKYKLQPQISRILKRSEFGVENLNLKEPVVLTFYDTSTMVEVEESYFIHNFNDFVSDVGGFMGLLLGWSFKSVKDDMIELITKVFKKDMI